ncbi:hypothetical protein DPMN_038968 [Dreissena polymorpha]|uniref:Uncharacterized protein n=1 Tax=Dreissena polymorpha TaxID=45954 RepID=A0A9D4MFN2_DREPO|nr:hypothetical protein DPMN_038968 [Dreissena polymorpha]
MVQKVRDAGCCSADIMQISGHKNVLSIINYSNISLQTQKKCSNILAGTSKRNESITTNMSQNMSQSESISISAHSFHSQLAVFLNPAQQQVPQEVSATLNPEAVAFPTLFDLKRGGCFSGPK